MAAAGPTRRTNALWNEGALIEGRWGFQDITCRSRIPGHSAPETLLDVRGFHRFFRPAGSILDVGHDVGKLFGADLVRGGRMLPRLVVAHGGDLRGRDFVLLRRVLRNIEQNHR